MYQKNDLTISVVCSVHAESYKNIGPLDNLGDIKNKFPNAIVKKLNPGWAKATDALYRLNGTGMSGQIVVKFDDLRPIWKKGLEKEPTSDIYRSLASQAEEVALSIDWVRWVPDTRIPLQRLVSKYGKPDESGFSDEDYQPYRSWNRGIEAYLTDDEKYVVRIDFNFTKEEYRKAYKEKYKFIPSWLKDNQTPKNTQRAE